MGMDCRPAQSIDPKVIVGTTATKEPAQSNHLSPGANISLQAIATKLPTTFHIQHFPGHLQIVPPLCNPEKDRTNQTQNQATSLLKTTQLFYEELAKSTQMEMEEIKSLFRFTRWESSRTQSQKIFAFTVRHDHLSLALSNLKALIPVNGGSAAEQWVINEAIPGVLPLQRSLKISSLDPSIARMGPADREELIRKMHNYWISLGATAVKVQKHSPSLPLKFAGKIPSKAIHLVVVFPPGGEHTIAEIKQGVTTNGFLTLQMADGQPSQWFTLPPRPSNTSHRENPKEARPRPPFCSECMLSGHAQSSCPGSKRCFLALKDLPNNEERIRFFAAYHEAMSTYTNAPRIEPLSDESGCIRNLCVIHYADVEGAHASIAAKATIEYTTTSQGLASLPILPINICTRCHQQGHRAAMCPLKSSSAEQCHSQRTPIQPHPRGMVTRKQAQHSTQNSLPAQAQAPLPASEPVSSNPTPQAVPAEAEESCTHPLVFEEENRSDSEYFTDSEETAENQRAMALPSWITVAKRQPRPRSTSPILRPSDQSKNNTHQPRKNRKELPDNIADQGNSNGINGPKGDHTIDSTPAGLTRRRYPTAIEQITSNAEKSTPPSDGPSTPWYQC
jgi:hypothetical protein